MLTIQFVPYQEIEDLSEFRRIKKLLGLVKEEKIILLEGRLKKHEEADLIKETMEEINDKFKGIEIAVVYPDQKGSTFLQKVRGGVANVLLGDRIGFTIVGPATIIKEIKKDPDKIQLLTEEAQNGSEKIQIRKKGRRWRSVKRG